MGHLDACVRQGRETSWRGDQRHAVIEIGVRLLTAVMQRTADRFPLVMESVGKRRVVQVARFIGCCETGRTSML